ncbi:hypothetical protein, partial [Arhodomonas sp. AD133]|uniref:hypothetical protein n=1 Tax=Arhodomonas sp. AD133 TaxID=3415009 RepID=UPI003EB87113
PAIPERWETPKSTPHQSVASFSGPTNYASRNMLHFPATGIGGSNKKTSRPLTQDYFFMGVTA